ncbi:hypothetical protein [Chlorogloeopsis sp. ULAP02]|uniref:hypothetical protein n=1 Tax=Chlorogloeopsis sp. ULAP02 TaxID=3107926 RepID=UPI003136B2CB
MLSNFNLYGGSGVRPFRCGYANLAANHVTSANLCESDRDVKLVTEQLFRLGCDHLGGYLDDGMTNPFGAGVGVQGSHCGGRVSRHKACGVVGV